MQAHLKFGFEFLKNKELFGPGNEKRSLFWSRMTTALKNLRAQRLARVGGISLWTHTGHWDPQADVPPVVNRVMSILTGETSVESLSLDPLDGSDVRSTM